MKKHFLIPAVLSAHVRAEDPSALDFVAKAVEREGGDMTRAAARLGIGVRTLYRWRDTVPGLAALIAPVAMGRTGAAARAVEARRQK